MKYQVEERVKFYDCDPSNVLHNVKYFYLFENARTELVRSVGFPYSRIEEMGLSFPLTENHIEYKMPAMRDDILIISVWINKIKTFSMKFEYEIYRGQDLIAKGYSQHCSIDSNFEFAEFPDELRTALEGFVE